MNFMNNLSGNSIQTSDGGIQLNNVDVLYTKVQRIYIKPERKEERQRDLRINVEIHSSISSPVCRKGLCVRLSDDDDSCFLYSLMIYDDDFKNLKADQNLLVDFDNFATQLISLLDQCHVPSTSTSKLPPKFLLELYEERGEWFCRFVEPKTMKNLCHLYLQISPASDDDIKTHMAVKIKQLTDSINNKNRDIANMETRLNSMSDDFDIKVRELDQLEQRYYNEKSQLEMQTSHQLKVEKDRFVQARSEWQRTSDMEKMDLERRHNDTIKQFQTELTDLRTQNTMYREKQLLLETTNSEQLKNIQKLEMELDVTQRDLLQIQKQNTKLENDYRDHDKLLNDLKTKVAVLEQELKDKNILINEHVEMIKITKEQKKQLEEKLNDKENQLQRREKNLNMISEDLRNSNDTKISLQNKISAIEGKLKRRTQTCEEQQKILDTKQKEIMQLSTKLDENFKERKELKDEIDNKKTDIKKLESKVSMQEQKLKDNEKLIDYLHRVKNENHSPVNQTPLMPINVGSQFQLTLPRQTKFPTKFDQINSRSTLTPASSSTIPTHYSGQLNSGFGMRNSGLPSSNINQTSRNSTARSAGVGVISDNSTGLATFSRSGQITSTSTPIDRMNIYQKLPNSIATTTETGNTENNNNNVQSSAITNGKSKINTATLHGGLRRSVLDKPILPSAYFPKSMH